MLIGAVALAVIMALLLVPFAYATWYTVNYDTQLNGGYWNPQYWNKSPYDYCTMSNGYATTYRTDNTFPGTWGNAEYCQGYKPWGQVGPAFSPVLLNIQQRLVMSCRCDSAVAFYWGQANMFVDLWVQFSGPVGNNGYSYAELLFYPKQFGIGSQGENTYTTTTKTDGGISWYVCAYRNWDVGSSFTYKEINVNNIIDYMCSQFGISQAQKGQGE